MIPPVDAEAVLRVAGDGQAVDAAVEVVGGGRQRRTLPDLQRKNSRGDEPRLFFCYPTKVYCPRNVC